MKFFFDILRGCSIGIANVIPGVSGGTLAVTMGIYDKIIHAVTNLFKHFKQSVKTLLPYAIGVVIGLVGLSFGIEYLFEYFPLPTICVFLGLIFGGVPALFKRVKGEKLNFAGVLFFLAAFALIILLPIIAGGERTDLTLSLDFVQIIKLFFIGVIASATMVIPGVSGSMILMSLGYYSPIISTINNFIRALLDFNLSAAFDAALLLIPFGIGVIVGIFLIAKLISFLLARFKLYTYCAVLGLVFASPYSILTSTEIPKPGFLTIAVSVVLFAAGLAGAYFLGKIGEAESDDTLTQEAEEKKEC